MEDIIIAFFNPENQVYQLLIALFLGAFIGLRRELNLQQQSNSAGLMGLRTVPLLVLLGTISTFFPNIPLLPLIGFLGVSVFVIIAYFNGVFNLKRIGLTTEITSLIMFLVGVLIGSGDILLAVIITVFVGIFNAYKAPMHNFAKHFSLKEWTGGLQLLIISLIILPFLPKYPIDPFGVFIPYNIWFIVVLLSGIGFVGYFLNKYFGQKKSIFLTSIFGSLVSSTIVTISLATRSKLKKNEPAIFFVTAILLSIIIMKARVLIVILIFSQNVSWEFVWAPLLMLIMSGLCLIYLFSKIKKTKHNTKDIAINPKIKSPFEIIPALKFTALFTILLFVIHFAEIYFANYGIYAVVFLVSFVDVDMPILSILDSFNNSNISKEVVWKVISIAVIINTFVKIIYVYIFARRDVFKQILFPIFLILLAGLSIFFIF